METESKCIKENKLLSYELKCYLQGLRPKACERKLDKLTKEHNDGPSTVNDSKKQT